MDFSCPMPSLWHYFLDFIHTMTSSCQGNFCLIEITFAIHPRHLITISQAEHPQSMHGLLLWQFSLILCLGRIEKSHLFHTCISFLSERNMNAKRTPTTNAYPAKINQHSCQLPTR